MSKKSNSTITFLGESANEVTGSAYLVSHNEYNLLLDFGLIQGFGDIWTSYQANAEQCRKVKPNKINAVLVSHSNSDHHANIPYLYSKGCNATIYVPEGNKKYIRLLWEDSFNIMQSDCAKIEKKNGRKAPLLYTMEDVETACSHIVEIDFSYPIRLNQEIEFEFIPAGHIQHAASIYLTLESGYTKKTIWYSGDIGPNQKQMYVEERQTPKRFDIGIMENTYNRPSRIVKLRDREKDLEKICSIVNEYNKTIIPAFALNRSQVILTELYNLWKQNRIPKNIKVVLDAPLAIRISNMWDGEEWDEIWHKWENLTKVQDYAQSQQLQKSGDKMIVIAGSGMCQSGRIVSWIQQYLDNPLAHLVFIGYCPEYGLAHDIKSNEPYINVDGKMVKNLCNYTELNSFSSHASREELLDLYSSLEGNKFYIVHGDSRFKPQFCSDLQDKLSDKAKSTKVVCSVKGQKIFL